MLAALLAVSTSVTAPLLIAMVPAAVAMMGAGMLTRFGPAAPGPFAVAAFVVATCVRGVLVVASAAVLGPAPAVMCVAAVLLHRPPVMRLAAAMVGLGPPAGFLSAPLGTATVAALSGLAAPVSFACPLAIGAVVARMPAAPARVVLAATVPAVIRVASGRWPEDDERCTDRQAGGEGRAPPGAKHVISPLTAAVSPGARSKGWLFYFYQRQVA